jgi:hypothetical protein
VTDVTFVSLMGDAPGHICRFMEQVYACARIVRPHVVLGVGRATLTGFLAELEESNNVDITYGPENDWNGLLGLIPRSRWVVCADPDLIWVPAVMERLVGVAAEHGAIACPMHMEDPQTFAGRFVSGAKRWTVEPPHAPGWDRRRLVEVQSCTGMIVGSYETVRRARWKNGGWRAPKKIYCDMSVMAYSPKLREPTPEPGDEEGTMIPPPFI